MRQETGGDIGGFRRLGVDLAFGEALRLGEQAVRDAARALDVGWQLGQEPELQPVTKLWRS